MKRPRKPALYRVRRLACAGGLGLGLGLGLLAGCRRSEPVAATVPGSELVATIGSGSLSVGEVEARLREKSPFARARYADPEQKRQFVEEQIRADVLAAEAERRGFAHDPDVVRAMKRLMVAKLLERDFEPKWQSETVPDAAVASYFKEHASEFKQSEQIRVLEIVVPDAARANEVTKELGERGAPPGDTKTFASLVARYSEDEASRAQGGELPFFARDSTALPRPLVDAAFALHAVGDVSPPVKLEHGYAIVMLAARRPGFERSLADVKPEIRQRLLPELRKRALDAFIADLVEKANVERHPENLDRIVVGGPALATSAPSK